MSVVRTVAPALLAVSIESVKQHVRESGNESDTEIERAIRAATAYAEKCQWCQLAAATFVERWDSFPAGDIVPTKQPLVSVTSLEYVDAAGVTQTLTVTTDYVVDAYSRPGRIVLAYGQSWPSTRGYIDDVVLTYVAGYSTEASMPDEVKHAIYLLCGHWLRNKEATGDVGAEIPFGVKALLGLDSFHGFF
jgi:uncharacterized phiE125 gp8 family phage protein